MGKSFIIQEIDEYKDPSRRIVKFRFRINSSGFSKQVVDAPANTSPNVGPAKGCVLVLGGESVSKESLYELSGLRLMPQLQPKGVVTAFGYCDAGMLEAAKQDFASMADELLASNISTLKATLAECEAARRLL